MTQVIQVRFYEDSKIRLSKSSYFYVVNSDTEYVSSKNAHGANVFDFIKTIHFNKCLCKIVNTTGYNYRDSKIVIEKILPYDASHSTDVKLKEISFAGMWLPTKLTSELDYAPFNENLFKEDNMKTNSYIDFSPKGSIYFETTDGKSYKFGNVTDMEITVSNSCDEGTTYEGNFTARNCCTDNDFVNNCTTYSSNTTSKTSVVSNTKVINTLADQVTTISDILARSNASMTFSNSTYNTTRKETNNMFENVFKNVKFGKATNVRMSIYGPAFYSKTNKEWIAFNNGDLTNVDGMTLEGENFCYMMPVAHDKVMIGDFILHNDTWGRVNYIDEATLSVEMPETHELVQVLPMKNIFGFNFYTKLVSLVDMNNFGASTDSPFGMLPMFMMMNNATGAKGTMESMLPMLLMANGGKMDMDNPMMLMALCGGQSNDMMMGLMLSQMMQKKDSKN